MAKGQQLDKRSLEVKASQGSLSKTKTFAATLFHILKDSPEQARRVWKVLKKLHKVVKSSALYNGEGIYADYIFSGDNIDYSALDKKVKYLQDNELKKPELDRKKYSHAIALTDPVLMQKVLDHGVNFDANEAAQKKMRAFINVLCPNGIQFIDTQSKNNFIDAIKLSESTGKKLIVLANHVSHMDAVVLDTFFLQLKNEGILPKNKKKRFIEGVYMALTPGVRQFSIAFDTTKVIGESDMQMLTSFARHNNEEVLVEYENDGEITSLTTTRMKQLKQMKKQMTEKYFANPQNEISIIFHYAGRGDNGGVKGSINPFMKDLLTSQDCVYVSFNMHDTEQLKPTKTDFFVGAHTWFQPYDIEVHSSKPWIGGEKSLEDIHQLSLDQRDIMRPQFKGIEKKQAHDKLVTQTQYEISNTLAMMDNGHQLTQDEINYYNKLVVQYKTLLQNDISAS